MGVGLKDRTALVLGGSRGLGLGVAAALADRGASVTLVGRDAATLRVASAQIAANGGKAAAISADLASEAGVQLLLSRVGEMRGPDILLLNGGGPPPFQAAEVDPIAWRVLFEAMVVSQMRVAACCLPAMRQRQWGRILIVSSTSSREPIPGLAASNALRASLAGWAKTLAGEVARDGITVNLLLPGRFATDRTDRLDRLDALDRSVDQAVIAAESQREIPAGRYGTPAEFGAVAAFLASEEASYVTGVAIPVDGGLSRSML
jgi:3-oxoacyl-[acyl-carrier protein] reductase